MPTYLVKVSARHLNNDGRIGAHLIEDVTVESPTPEQARTQAKMHVLSNVWSKWKVIRIQTRVSKY